MMKFDKVISNLRESLVNATTANDMNHQFCHVRKDELEALIHCANIVKFFSAYQHQDNCRTAIRMLEGCADE